MTIGLPTTGRSWNWGRKRVLPDGFNFNYHKSVQYCMNKDYKPKAKTRDHRCVLEKMRGAMRAMLRTMRGAGDDKGRAGDGERRTVRQEA